MTMTQRDDWFMYRPTPEQVEQLDRFSDALCDEINRLHREEGISPRIPLTGLFSIINDLITSQQGPQYVAAWYRSAALRVEQLQAGTN
jgi:hypothetical protein